MGTFKSKFKSKFKRRFLNNTFSFSNIKEDVYKNGIKLNKPELERKNDAKFSIKMKSLKIFRP